MEVTSNASQPNKNYRLECGQKIIDFEEAAERLGSQRRAAECTGIARSIISTYITENKSSR